MNETEVEDRPVDNDEVLELDPNDFIDEEEESSTVEDTTEPVTEEVDTPVENEELDYTPLLEELSKKIKYKDEEIKINDLEDVVKNYQKGLNYDTLQDKLNALSESKQIKLIERLAKESDMTPDEYVEYVVRTEEQNKLNELVEKGLSDEEAKEVLEAKKIKQQMQLEKEQREREQKAKEEADKRDKDNEEFIKAFPDVKEIPKEVLLNAEKSSLKLAYTEYLLQQAKKEIEQLRVKEKTPVTSVTEHGSVPKEKKDDFLTGLFGE